VKEVHHDIINLLNNNPNNLNLSDNDPMTKYAYNVNMNNAG